MKKSLLSLELCTCNLKIGTFGERLTILDSNLCWKIVYYSISSIFYYDAYFINHEPAYLSNASSI
jgi:hypothetical protein